MTPIPMPLLHKQTLRVSEKIARDFLYKALHN